MLLSSQKTNASQVAGLFRSESALIKAKIEIAGGLVRGETSSQKAPLLSKAGLPVLPVKKVSPEVIAALRDKEEEKAKARDAKPVNPMEEMMKRKEENQKVIQLAEFRRKQEIMDAIKQPRDEIEEAIYEKMNDYVKEKGRRQFFKYYLVTNDQVQHENVQDKFINKRPLIDPLKFNNMAMQSLAEKKRIWQGDGGLFKKSQVQEWYKIWDETKLFKDRKEVL